MRRDFTQQMQSYVAETCVGATAIRNQGGSGLIDAARGLFKEIHLSRIPRSAKSLGGWLDRHTAELLNRFPKQARHFGTARKALNLFLRSAAYNVYLAKDFELQSLLPLLELPLDSYAAKHLLMHRPELAGRWVGLKAVTVEAHAQYQQAALDLANEWDIYRVDLDVFFYREEPAP